MIVVQTRKIMPMNKEMHYQHISIYISIHNFLPLDYLVLKEREVTFLEY